MHIEVGRGNVIALTIRPGPAHRHQRSGGGGGGRVERGVGHEGGQGDGDDLAAGLVAGHGEHRIARRLVGQPQHFGAARSGQKLERRAGLVAIVDHRARGIRRDGPDQSGLDHRAVFAIGGAECHLDRQRRRFGLGHDRQCFGQFGGVGGGAELAAGFLGQTLQLRQRLGVRDVKADHVGGEVDAGFLEHPADRAGVTLAGLDPVRDQDDGRDLLGEAQRLGGLDHRVRQRRLALGVDRVHRRCDGGAVGARLDQQFDVRTIALAPVAVAHQPQFLIRGQGAQKLADHLARDHDLVDAVDLPPHRAGPVQHEDRPWRVLRRRDSCGKDKGNQGDEQDAQHKEDLGYR